MKSLRSPSSMPKLLCVRTRSGCSHDDRAPFRTLPVHNRNGRRLERTKHGWDMIGLLDLMVIQWDLMVIQWDLMGFNGIL